MEAKIFQSGNSQAVRIPKKFQFDVTTVEIFKCGDGLLLKPKSRNLAEAFYLLGQMPEDFTTEGRDDTLPQEREAW